MTQGITDTHIHEIHLDLSQATPEQCFMIGKATYEFIQRLMANPDTAKMLREKTLEVKRRRMNSNKERSENNESEYRSPAVVAERQEIHHVRIDI